MSASLNKTNQKHFTLKEDPDRNKKCPHCNVNFCHTKSVDIHIAHAYSEIQSLVNSDVSGINTEHLELIIPNDHTKKVHSTHGNVNSINTESVDATSVNGSNIENPAGNTVTSINNNSNMSNGAQKMDNNL